MDFRPCPTSVVRCATLAAAVLVSLQLAATASVSLFLEINREAPAAGGERFVAYPFVGSNDPTVQNASVQDAFGLFTGSFGAASGPSFASLGELTTALQGNPWEVTVDFGDGDPQTYSFEVTINGLAESDLGATAFGAPTQGAQFEAPADVAFEWSGPSGFAGLTLSLYERDPFQFLVFQPLDPDTTTWSPDAPLGPAQCGADARFNRSGAPWVTITQPSRLTDSGTEFLEGWTASSMVNSVAFVEFDVVPEPGAWAAAAAGGLLGFALWRRARRR